LEREEVTLNQTHVRACKNTTEAEYRQQRRQSMRQTPLGAAQWGWYGGAGIVFVVLGGVVFRRSTLPA